MAISPGKTYHNPEKAQNGIEYSRQFEELTYDELLSRMSLEEAQFIDWLFAQETPIVSTDQSINSLMGWVGDAALSCAMNTELYDDPTEDFIDTSDDLLALRKNAREDTKSHLYAERARLLHSARAVIRYYGEDIMKGYMELIKYGF